MGDSSFAVSAAQGQAEVEAYWTPQRLLNARPLELHPAVDAGGLPITLPSTIDNSPAIRGEGSEPKATVAPHEVKTLIPEAWFQPEALGGSNGVTRENDVLPNATSSFGAYFTTHRVFPDAATTAPPNSRHGKLYFTDPMTGSNHSCSASTLRPRLVVTAGHCVTHPSTTAAGRYIYKNFLFIPSYRNGIAPFGIWTPKAVWVTNTWYFSDGSVPNAQDVGMLVMNDNNGKRIGDVTGWNGYWTNQLAKNHLTMLGYPGNLDSGQRMEINHAYTFAYGGNNTYIYGSAMRGGSSGGGWIMNYGVAPVSNPLIPELGTNYLVAVTSYGPIATEPKYQGASNLDSRFISLLNTACGGTTTGNCN